jgi:hypothetical protein
MIRNGVLPGVSPVFGFIFSSEFGIEFFFLGAGGLAAEFIFEFLQEMVEPYRRAA